MKLTLVPCVAGLRWERSVARCGGSKATRNPAWKPVDMVNIPHYLQDFIHVRWCRISSTNTMAVPFSMNPLSWILFFLASRNSAPTKNNGNKKGGNKYRDHYNVMGIINKLQNVAGNLQGFQDLAYYNSAWSLGWCFSIMTLQDRPLPSIRYKWPKITNGFPSGEILTR